MDAKTALEISEGLNTQTHTEAPVGKGVEPIGNWTEAEQSRIAQIMETKGCTRGNAIRVMRAEQLKLKVVDPLAQATEIPASQLRPVASAKKDRKAKAAKTPKKEKSDRKAKAAKTPKKEKSDRKPKYDESKFISMYKAGKSVEEIKKATGASYAFIRWRLMDNKVWNPDRKAGQVATRRVLPFISV